MDSDFIENAFGLGFNPYKKPSLFPLNFNHICSGSHKLINPNLLDFEKIIKMDVFPDDEALMDFLGVYDDHPSFHHKKWRPYYLKTGGYFREDTNY